MTVYACGHRSAALRSVFFFYSFSAHPDLHSFPTRRSSDLGLLTTSGSLGLLLPPSLPLILYAVVAQIPRSEEHTSELQSHSDLVCRLLLEKKKHLSPLVEPPPVGLTTARQATVQVRPGRLV